MENYLIFATYIVFYCFVHSLLADPFILKDIYNEWWYRASYVFQSVILLFPMVFFYFKLPDTSFFNPASPIREMLLVIFLFALLFGLYAAKSYDNKSFLGIKQIKKHLDSGVEHFEVHRELTSHGALRYVRHPYYFTGIVLLWSRPLFVKDLVLNIVFSLYFILGSINEERKLKIIFGEQYRTYAENVPMLLPKFLNPLYWLKK
ncbi:MAG: isoprenylcysteine carboxylmethyltransferase family protein [Flexistipes sinusarabici]|uniref:Isoprenylcysteine carboxylmethyltransferase family protein n=1 Tax=Flexistipes sinusarabici TaxID=2352 RepID=A0A5D0MH72_FLESI|nr:methyltransferase [Flexistipes sinusarabici]TYB33064.1 MAG: isoprenylcysteine carboxylmethyltransferase family protein [Flexistipes sinusarabici]